MKPSLLFLSHRIPYPPNKGDKIRSFHTLKHLSKRYRIHLGTFVDDDVDWQHVDTLGRWCESSCVRPLDPGRAKLRSLRGLLSGEPLTLPYYRDAVLQKWVEKTLKEQQVERIVIYSSAMAQYVMGNAFRHATRIMDLVDVDSDKWRQYARKAGWPMRWIYRREAERLLQFERRSARAFDVVYLVSEAEAELFRTLAPETAGRVFALYNGVDLDFFKPDAEYSNPYSEAGPHVVFTGAMDYWPNVDAVVWFVEDVLPGLRSDHPGLMFHIVGARPTEKVQKLGEEAGVEVTGSVADIRPYLAHADVVVAPMRIARGIQNKVLEAMAMAKPVVVTSMGLEGIDARHGEEVLVADDAEGFVRSISENFRDKMFAAEMGRNACRKVREQFAWEKTLPELDRWLGGDVSVAAG